MTSPFVLTVHKNFAYKLKEAGCNQQQITSHLQEVLLEDNEIAKILQEMTSQSANCDTQRSIA